SNPLERKALLPRLDHQGGCHTHPGLSGSVRKLSRLARWSSARAAARDGRIGRGFPGRLRSENPLFRELERDILQALQFRVNVGALVEGEPSANALCLAGQAVLDPRIGVHARARRLAPRAVAPPPAGNHPPLAFPIPARGKRGGEYLVLVGPRVKSGQAGEHYAHLHTQSGELGGATVGDTKLHARAVLAWFDK